MKLLPAATILNGEDYVVYANRKRKTWNLNAPSQTKQVKTNDNGKTYTLNEAINTKDSTTVNVSFHKFRKFDSEEYEDSEPTFIKTTKENEMYSADDNDCIITDELSTPIIDLSDDDSRDGCKDGSNKMIEVIMCNDIEPESTESNEEILIEITNDLDDQEHPQPLWVNYNATEDAEAVSSPSIDLTMAQSIEYVNCDSNRMLTVDLTDESTPIEIGNVNAGESNSDRPTPDEELGNDDVEEPISATIERMKQKVNSRYPGTLQSISWNDKTKQFEVSISKQNNRFKNSAAFHQYLLDVVKDIHSKKPVAQHSEPPNKETPTDQVTEHVVWGSKLQRTITKCSELNRKATNDHQSVNVLNGNGTSATSCLAVTQAAAPVSSSQSSGKKRFYSKANVTQILRKSEFYLGVTAKTFQRIENLLTDSFRNRSLLILLFRKIKLNESFTVLSEVLCPNNADCSHIFKEFLIAISRKLKGLLRWPAYSRESLAIVDVFEIEIEQPNSTVARLVSFCSRRQRHIVKFIICCTSTGYIFHVSAPFHSMQGEIFAALLASIPKCSSIVANPNLFDKQFNRSTSTRIASLFDCFHQPERNVMQQVVRRLRDFSFLNSVSDVNTVNQLQHTLSLVACVCNLEGEKGSK